MLLKRSVKLDYNLELSSKSQGLAKYIYMYVCTDTIQRCKYRCIIY